MKNNSEQTIVNRTIRHFTDLKAWQINHNLVLKIYKITKGFPKEEKYGLVNQIRRAASSITANIAEGWGRYHADKARFYYNARGSNCEAQNFIILAKDLGYLQKDQYEDLKQNIFKGFKVLNGLITSIKKLKKSY